MTLPIVAGDKLRIEKGCRDLSLTSPMLVRVLLCEEIPADRGAVRLRVQWNHITRTLYVRHKNRLSEPTFRANNGNPCKVIVFSKWAGK